MATTRSQNKWRGKNRFVKSQLNVMARKLVHQDLDEIAKRFELRGKGEAVGFSSFVTKGLMQYADHNQEASRLLELFAEAYDRDRDLYT
ncbi:MAG: hypothetical protein OEU46_09230 [Alphaproteobacteria bacterium]|nr:hypothetical protein [Alphaproteobacteria bacterium]